jgi:hypothetical protein
VHELLIDALLTVCVLLGGKTDKTLLHKVDLKGVEASDEGINSQVILEAVYQVRVGHVLGDHVAWLAFDFLLLAHNFDSASATRRTRLHDIHVFEVLGLAVHHEFAVLVRENVCLRTEIVLLEDATHARQVLPHKVFAADLKRLWEMVHFLVLCRLFQVFWLRLARPHNVPLGAVWAYDPETSILERVYYGVVDMSGLSYFEAESHIVLFKVVMSSHLHFLERPQLGSDMPLNHFQECGTLSQACRRWLSVCILLCWTSNLLKAVFRIGEENPRRWLRLAQSHRLQEHDLFGVGLKYGARNFPIPLGKHLLHDGIYIVILIVDLVSLGHAVLAGVLHIRYHFKLGLLINSSHFLLGWLALLFLMLHFLDGLGLLLPLAFSVDGG